jgi:cytidylate kinase
MGSAFVVAVDGPSASGKTTVAERLAARFDGLAFDSGLLYRALAWLALREAVAKDDGAALAALVPRLAVADRALPGGGRVGYVQVDGRERAAELHAPGIDAVVSAVSRHPQVRDALRSAQRSVACRGFVAVAGRDIGTVVFPDAGLKVFLEASAAERAQRRAAQRGDDAAVPAILAAILERDTQDARQSARAPDAVPIQTEGASVDAVVHRIAALVRARRGGDEGGDC